MEGHADRCVERCELACTDVSASQLAETPCMEIINSTRKMSTVQVNFAPACVHIVLKNVGTWAEPVDHATKVWHEIICIYHNQSFLPFLYVGDNNIEDCKLDCFRS